MTSASVSETTSTVTISRRRFLGSWMDFFLLFFMFVNLAGALAAAAWAPGLERLLAIAMIAVIAATLVAQSDFGFWFSRLYGVIVGLASLALGLAPLAPDNLERQQRVFYLLERAVLWATNAITGAPQADSKVFVMIMAVVIWVLTFNATWSHFREGRKWQAVLPAGLAMLVNLYFAPPRLSFYFVMYLFCAILLLVRSTLAEREQEWFESRVSFPFDISFDFMRDGILFALFVIIVAWMLPSAARGGQLNDMLEPLRQPWKQIQEEWTRLFSTVNYNRVVGISSFGTNMSLGGPRNMTEDLVMDVQTPVNRYYRAVVYDTYDQGGWSLRGTGALRLNRDKSPLLPNWRSRELMTIKVTHYTNSNLLFAAPQPVSPSLAYEAVAIPPAGTDTTGWENQAPDVEVELAFIASRRPVAKGDSYEFTSSLSVATEAQLRSAGDLYPAAIGTRYLQLPDTVPQRVLDLADELAAGAETPYDTARRIEAYARSFVYNDQIPGPAPDQDPVDYFLFEEKQGYCNYYASAMAVMLRHLGIPARLASGYATGERQPDGSYRIRENDAHTWVEVFFPQYGWIEFEPTASEPALERLAGEAVTPTPTPEDDFDPGRFQDPGTEPPPDAGNAGNIEFSSAFLRTTGGALLLIGSILGVLFVAVWGARRWQRSSTPPRPVFRVVPQGFAVRLWEKILGWCWRLGLIPQPSLTPFEQAGALAALVPEASADLQTIATLYAKDQYSPHVITPDEASDAQGSWLALLPRLRRLWLRRTLHLPRGLRRALLLEK